MLPFIFIYLDLLYYKKTTFYTIFNKKLFFCELNFRHETDKE